MQQYYENNSQTGTDQTSALQNKYKVGTKNGGPQGPGPGAAS